MSSLLEPLSLGTLQGTLEWLPVSSEGFIVLARLYLFPSSTQLQDLVQLALFLHLGTALAASIYFRKIIFQHFRLLPGSLFAQTSEGKLTRFITISFFVSSTLGYLLLKIASHFQNQLHLTSQSLNLLVGFLLLITGYLQLKKKPSGLKTINHISTPDSFILGISQAFAVLPGLSRSGLTISALLLRRFNNQTALKLSFLMSIPITLAGNILLNLHYFRINSHYFTALAASFTLGLITIHLLLKAAQKINFAPFVIAFGLLVITFSFITV